MQKKTERYCFTVDDVSTSGCCGWYTRLDGADKKLRIRIGNSEMTAIPDMPRQDVVAAGITKDAECGFDIKFDPEIKNGETVSISTADGEILFQKNFDLKNFAEDAVAEKLIRVVEPFVELDIQRVRQKLVKNNISDQYRRQLRETLADKGSNELRETLCDILAEIKTTQHLLAAAYLDYTRYKDPDFLKNLPKFEIAANERIVVDMRGDITGDNWYEPEEDGRWAGPRKKSSILLPAMAAGEYRIQIEVAGEIFPGAIDTLSLLVNDSPVDLKRDSPSIPCVLDGNFTITNGENPFLSLAFNYFGEIREAYPEKGKRRDTRKLSFRLKTISFIRER